MKVLVTGANGLLASNIVNELNRRKISVRGMVRRTSNLLSLKGLELEKVYGDLTNPQDIEQAVVGCDVIIHAGADTSHYHLSFNDYLPVNVHATETILEAANKHKVKKLIYVSTANTFGHGTLENPGTEKMVPRYPFTNSNYAISKQAAQHILLNYAERAKPEITVVNPTFMIGGRDARPSSGKLVLMGYKRKVIPVPPGGKNFVAVADVAAGTCNAIEKGKNGECYLLAGENLSYYDFFKLIESIAGDKKIFVKLPASAFALVGGIGDILAKLGLGNLFTGVNTRIMCIKNFYTAEKSIKELAMPQTPVKQAVEDCLGWFKQHGYIV